MTGQATWGPMSSDDRKVRRARIVVLVMVGLLVLTGLAALTQRMT